MVGEWLSDVLFIPNRNQPQVGCEAPATAGLLDIDDSDARILAEPGIDLVLQRESVLAGRKESAPQRLVLPEELDFHQRSPAPPNEDPLRRPRTPAGGSRRQTGRSTAARLLATMDRRLTPPRHRTS